MITVILTQIIPLVLLLFILIRDDHLNKRDTPEGRVLFRICILTILTILSGLYYNLMVLELVPDFGYPYYIIMTEFFAENFLTSIAIIEWNLHVDYALFRSDHHEAVRRRTIWFVGGILFGCAMLAVAIISLLFDAREVLDKAADVGMILCVASDLYFIIRSVVTVLKAGKRRNPPSFLKIRRFMIPLMLVTFVTFVPDALGVDIRSIGLTIAIVLTHISVLDRYRYVDPYTGFFNRDYLPKMNEYMDKSGYPNGVGVLFNLPGSRDKLALVLLSFKPADAEIFSFGDGKFVLVAQEQKESVIRLLIDGVKAKASEEPGMGDIETSYIIREEGESTGEFTKRLLEL